ncbi:hypothetical protein PPERSA_08178 [Pseudocohnilembus persalinus]|uniref:C2HC/C3H-type domain-containing protein n=1 Tax=Pseudocohnilembus persalinus TaxID=266149 RepID=A0A0V0R3B7_PSEPJ|nr:hypothetical protein PPERSA_08178 [Pseudocohnilembus persalinus]|eukprot:KRX08975.1 hypothetical protein PPERSA_08178 [Pseudocohnilembus persalinus]
MNYAQNINWNQRNSSNSIQNQNNRTNLQRTGELLMGPNSQSSNNYQMNTKFGTGNFQQNNTYDIGNNNNKMNQYGSQNQLSDLNGRKQNSYLEQNMYGNYGNKGNNEFMTGFNNNTANPNYNKNSNLNMNNFNNNYNQLQQNLYGNSNTNLLNGNSNQRLMNQKNDYNIKDFRPNNYGQQANYMDQYVNQYKVNQNNPYQSAYSYNPTQNKINNMPFSVEQNPNFNYNKNYSGNEGSLNLDAQKLMDKINKMSANIGQYQYPNNNNMGNNNGNSFNNNYQKQMGINKNPQQQQYSNQFPSPPQNMNNMNHNNQQQQQNQFQYNNFQPTNNFNSKPMNRQLSQTPQRNQQARSDMNSLNRTGDYRNYNNQQQKQNINQNANQIQNPNNTNNFANKQLNQPQNQDQNQIQNQNQNQIQQNRKPPVMPNSGTKRPQNSTSNFDQNPHQPAYSEHNFSKINQYQNQQQHEQQLPSANRHQKNRQNQQNQNQQQQQQMPVGNDEIAAVASGKQKIPEELLQQEQQAKNERMAECPEGCGRSFREGALNAHMKACRKIFQEKRKKFDSAAYRAPDEQQELNALNPNKKKKNNYNPMEAAKLKNQSKGKINSKWKQRSEQFRQAMRSCRKAEDGGQYVPQEPVDDGLTQCPTCGRKFNDTAAKRHMPICAEKAKRGEKVNKVNQRRF